MAHVERFLYRSARSGSLVTGIGIALAIETMVLHLMLVQNHPVAAWSLTALSAGTLVWWIADYQAMGTTPILLGPDTIDFVIGRRFAFSINRSQVAAAIAPTWRDVPAAGTPGYLNATKPAPPNVLLTLSAPASVRLLAGVAREVQLIGIHLDEPARFLASLGAPATGAGR